MTVNTNAVVPELPSLALTLLIEIVGVGSSLVIVTTAVAGVPMVAPPVAPESVTLKVSSVLFSASGHSVTVKVWLA